MAALEFCLPPGEVGALLQVPSLRRRGTRPVESDRVWYDTAGGELASEGLSLCEHGGVWRLEAAYPAAGQLWPPGAPAPVLAEAGDLEQLAGASGRTLPEPLMPLAGFHGRHRVLSLGDSAAGAAEAGTLTVLEGVLRGIAQERPVCRLVLQGPAPRLLELSTEMARTMRLTVPRWSLASEAIALARADTPAPRHTGAPEIAAGTSLSDAVAIVVGHLADVILAGSLTAGDGHSPEPVHQMRVAVRRLRSALSVFKRAAGEPVFDAVKPGLQHLAAVLGKARDWDVFLGETGAAVGAALPDEPRVAAMLSAGSRRRTQAYGELRRVLASAEFRQLEIALAQLAALRPWEAAADAEQTERLHADAADFATRSLARRLEHMLAPGDDVADLPAPELHAIRKDGKRLRYACEFFAPLFGKKAPRRYIDTLSGLQEALGHLNDTASAGVLMSSLGSSADRQFAAGVVQGYVAAQVGDTRRTIAKAWVKFRRQEPFWT